VPTDLDLKPYRDEHDFDLLKRMHEAVEQGQTPKGIDAAHIRKALERHAPELKQHLQDMVRKKR
jgi:hypothetical protein